MAVDSPLSLADLPEACIVNVLSFTSPRDACRLSLVCRAFRSAAGSDALWDSFLPPDHAFILSGSSASPSFPSKKHLYLALYPVLVDDGLKSFHLDMHHWKKCYMIAARSLTIVWGGTPRYWRWISVPEARFEEVAELVKVCWLEIGGCIYTHMLSPSTLYVAYLVFKFNATPYGFEFQPVDVAVGTAGSDSDTQWRTVCLHDVEDPDLPCPTQRSDGWLEIEVGEFFNEEGDDSKLKMAVYEVKAGDWKSGLIVQGFEIRPKLNT